MSKERKEEPNYSKRQSYIEAVERLINNETNYNELALFIDKIWLSNLNKITNFSKKLVEKYPNLKQQKDIFNKILSKIETETTVKNNEAEYYSLQAESSFYAAQAIIGLNKEESRDQIKLDSYTKALDLLDKANILKIRNNLDILNTEAGDVIEPVITDLIAEYKISSNAFELAQRSLTSRATDLEADHSAILKGLITAAKIGYRHEDRAIKVTALKYAEEAYNMGMRTGNNESAAEALTFTAEIFKSFGYTEKAARLTSESEYLKAISADSEPQPYEQIIINRGVADDLTLEIQKKIYYGTLDNIFYAAARGKWTEKNLWQSEIGVKGYIDNLAESLKELNTSENLKTALMLCFEAINLGITASDKKDPTVAVIFAQTYPEIIKEIINLHPEYFINGHIVRSVLPDAHEHSEALLGINLNANGEYNAYLEKVMIPIIEARLQDIALTPVKELVKTGNWSEDIKNQMLDYASDKFLTEVGRIQTSNLGQNLSAVNDAVNIARILIFKTIISAMQEIKSVNLSPVNAFTEQYKDLAARVLINHPEYITNKFIEVSVKDICGLGGNVLLSDQSMILSSGLSSEDHNLTDEEPLQSNLAGATDDYDTGNDIQ